MPASKIEDNEIYTVENDKLLAAFIGLKIIHTKYDVPGVGYDYDMEIVNPDCFDHDEQLMYLYDCDVPEENFKFSSSWDWLMPVVEKIESLDGLSVEMEGCFCAVRDSFNNIIVQNTNCTTSKIEATYQAVIEFIQWYNANASAHES